MCLCATNSHQCQLPLCFFFLKKNKTNVSVLCTKTSRYLKLASFQKFFVKMNHNAPTNDLLWFSNKLLEDLKLSEPHQYIFPAFCVWVLSIYMHMSRMLKKCATWAAPVSQEDFLYTRGPADWYFWESWTFWGNSSWSLLEQICSHRFGHKLAASDMDCAWVRKWEEGWSKR